MSEETRRVLDMLSQSKITVDEADRLLAAIGSGSAGPKTSPAAEASSAKGTATGESPSPRYLRITVTRTGSAPDDAQPARRTWMGLGYQGGHDKEVTIRVPVTLVRNGMRLGAMIPGLAGGNMQARLRERGMDVDLSKIDAETIDRLVREFGEINIDIDSGRGRKAEVRITCE